MQKIHNIIFYSLIVVLGLSVILLTFGNSKVGGTLILISIALLIVEQIVNKKALSKESEKEQWVENSYTPPSRMDFLESTLANDLIGKQEGFDEAVMGFDYHSMRLIYSIEGTIYILMAKNSCKYDEAKEFVYNNMVGALGDDEPIWLECSIDVEL